MNHEEMKGNWKQFNGKIKEKWGMLTDDELTEAKGRVEFISGKIQEKYGHSKDEAYRQVNELLKSFEDKFITPKKESTDV